MKSTKRFSKPIILTAIAATLVACGQAQPSSVTPAALGVNANQAVSTLGSLELRIAGLGGRRVLATVAEIAYLKVTIEYAAPTAPVSRTVDAALLVAAPDHLGRVNFTDLTAGQVTVTVEAFDAANQRIGQASRPAEIVAMEAARVTIPLKLDDTIEDSLNGNLAVNINATDGDIVTRSPSPNPPTESGRPELPDWSPSPTVLDPSSPIPSPTGSSSTAPTPTVEPTSTPRPLPSDFSVPPDSTLAGAYEVPETSEPLWFSLKTGAMKAGANGLTLNEWISAPVNVKHGSEIFITISDRVVDWYGRRQKVFTAWYIDGGYPEITPRKTVIAPVDYEPDLGEIVLTLQSGVSKDFNNAKIGMWDFRVFDQ